MVTSYRDHRIPCTCVELSCPQISAISYDRLLHHPEFRGPFWIRIKDPGDTDKLRGKYLNFTMNLYVFKEAVENWPYFKLIPKTGQQAFIKLLQKTMTEDRGVMITSDLASQLWDLCPREYKLRFECAARARFQHEVQEGVLLYLKRFSREFQTELDGVSMEKFYQQYLHRAHEGNFRLNVNRDRNDPVDWE